MAVLNSALYSMTPRGCFVIEPRHVTSMSHQKRRYPIGAELIGADQTHFRVWAPKAQQVDVVLQENAAKDAGQTFHALAPEERRIFFRFCQRWRGRLLSFSRKRQVVSGSCITLSTRWSTWSFLHCRSGAVSVDRFALVGNYLERPDHLRNAYRHVHEGGNVARRCAAIGRAGTYRNHCDRDDAGRGFPRQVWLGIRRR